MCRYEYTVTYLKVSRNIIQPGVLILILKVEINIDSFSKSFLKSNQGYFMVIISILTSSGQLAAFLVNL